MRKCDPLAHAEFVIRNSQPALSLALRRSSCNALHVGDSARDVSLRNLSVLYGNSLAGTTSGSAISNMRVGCVLQQLCNLFRWLGLTEQEPL